MNYKNLKVGRKTSTITMEHRDSEESAGVIGTMKAISILLGGYNDHGRAIDLDSYSAAKRRFWDIIQEIEQQL